MNIRISLRYGTVRQDDVVVTQGITIAQIKRTYGAVLRLPESVQALVNNEPVSDSYVLEDRDSVTFEKEACKKA